MLFNHSKIKLLYHSFVELLFSSLKKDLPVTMFIVFCFCFILFSLNSFNIVILYSTLENSTVVCFCGSDFCCWMFFFLTLAPGDLFSYVFYDFFFIVNLYLLEVFLRIL